VCVRYRRLPGFVEIGKLGPCDVDVAHMRQLPRATWRRVGEQAGYLVCTLVRIPGVFEREQLAYKRIDGLAEERPLTRQVVGSDIHAHTVGRGRTLRRRKPLLGNFAPVSGVLVTRRETSLPRGWDTKDRGRVSSPADGPDVRSSVRTHVEHAIRHLLRPDEVDDWNFRWAQDDADPGVRFLVVDLVAAGEHYMGYLYQEDADYPVEQALDIFTDGLEAFISESRFAWGQQRLLTDRPWYRD